MILKFEDETMTNYIVRKTIVLERGNFHEPL